MSKFDVFINGIQPSHIDKKQQIIESFSNMLKLNSEKAEKILKTPNTQINKSVSKEKAVKFQQSLHKIGVICVYRPSIESTGLSLEPIEVKEEGILTACPNCDHQFSDDTAITPEKCNACGIYIEKFLRNSVEQKEKDEIKQKLLQKNAMRTTREQQAIDKQTEEIRKKILEQAVLKENTDLENKEKISKKTYALAGGSLLIATVACVSYLYLGQTENEKLPTQLANSSSDSMANQETIQAQEELTTQIPGSENGADGLSTEIPLTTTDSASESQDALKETYGKASKVLNAFGLDPNAVGNAGIKNTKYSDVKLSGKSNNISNSIATEVLTPFLLDFSADEQEWEHYLTEQAEQSIINNNFITAQKIIHQLTDTENYINLSGKLLKNSQQPGLKAEIDSNIETRIKSSSFELQAQYFSHAAANKEKQEASNLLFNRADNFWKTITNPSLQLSSALKIAVSYFKAGNLVSANRYFSKINPLLSKITSAENQITSRIAVSRAFKDVGQNKIALNWLGSTNKFFTNSDESSLREIVNGYAYLDQINTVQALVKQASTFNIQDKLLYSAIRVSLDAKLNENAISLVNLIQNPTNKALSYTLLASYLGDNSIYLTSAESLVAQDIPEANHKLIVLSRIAQQYAKQKNTVKVTEFFEQSEELIFMIPSSPEKDEVLSIFITNFAGSTKQESAKALLPFVQSPATVRQIEEKINRRSKLLAILKQ